MRGFFLAAAISLVFIFTPALAEAALTEGQIQSILLLLESFGAEERVVHDVELALRGSSANCVFNHSLYRGVSDKTTQGQVTRVQNFLYVDPATGYYGTITEQAVQVFQIAHGVVSSGTPETNGFGVVGPKTRAKLVEVCESQNKTETYTPTESVGQVENTQVDNSTGVNTDTGVDTSTGSTVQTGTIPEANVSVADLRSAVYAEGVAQGLPHEDIENILDALPATEAEVAQETGGSANALSAFAPSVLSGALSQLLSGAGASAGAGTNFGTPKVISVLPCPCSGTSVVYMQPTGPQYVTALSYIPGSQIYESYQISHAGQSVLGKYIPGAGVCLVPAPTGCAWVPTQGIISSFTGSSL